MAEDGGHGGYADPPALSDNNRGPAPLKTIHPNSNDQRPSDIATVNLQQELSPLSPRVDTPNPFSRKNTSLDLDDYFVCEPEPGPGPIPGDGAIHS